MNTEFKVTATNDYAFKVLFGSAENRPVLAKFLSLILDLSTEEFEEIEVSNPFLDKRSYKSKQGILDIKLTLKNGKKINLEMQNTAHACLTNRVLFYWASRYNEGFFASEPYSGLNKCISIMVLNDSFEYADELHSVYKLLNTKTHREFDNLMELHFLNLTKLPNTNPIKTEVCQMTELEKWLLFIQTTEKEVREMLAKNDEMLDQANLTMNRFFSSLEERHRYLEYLMYECDKVSQLEDATQKGLKEGLIKGREEGREEGEKKAQAEIAKNLLAVNFPIPEIAKATGLTEEEIKKLCV